MLKIPNILIDGMKRLTLTEAKLFFLSYHKTHDAAAEVEIKKILPCLGGSQYAQLQRAIKSLMKKVLICQDGEEKIFLHLIESARHDQAVVSVRSSKELIHIVEKCFQKYSRGYTKVRPTSILKLRSFYSIMIYLHACRNIRFAEFTATIPELKKLFNIEGQYARQRQFINLLNNAIQEVNEKTEIKIKTEKKVFKRNIANILFRLAVRIDMVDLRDILDEPTALNIVETYPADYIKKCIVITEKNHRPERGTKSGYFLKVIKNGYEKYLLSRSKNIQSMQKRIDSKVNAPAPGVKSKKITAAEYNAMPDFAKKLYDQFIKGFSSDKKQN